MWLQVIEAAVGSAAVAGLAFGLARHSTPSYPADPIGTQPDPGRSGVAAAGPVGRTEVVGEAFERVWAQAEAVGWARLVAAGVLVPVGAPVVDPGNPLGTRLVLVEHLTGALGEVRVLLGVNPVPGTDGRHELVAIPVPPEFDDPLAAAAWTYDDPDHPVRTTRDAYARLTRRT